MFHRSNIYYRFLNDCAVVIAEFEKENDFICKELSKINSVKMIVSKEEKKVLRDRYRINFKEISRLYGDIYSLKVACIKNSVVNPCKEAKKFYFSNNEEYVQFLLSKMVECGYIYNENIIDDVRNMYMRRANIEDKDLNINVGNKIRLSKLILSKNLRNAD